MADRAVLVDTSAWIAFFRSGTSAVGDLVTELIGADRAMLAGPVLTELLQGVRSGRESADLRKLMGILPYAAEDRADWESAGETLGRLRARGVSLPLTDALIATIARRRSLDVLTLDVHFQHLDVRLLPLE